MPTAEAARFHALVPCAGSGSRSGAGGPKQYVMLAGRPMVAHTLAALRGVGRIERVLVAVAPDDTAFERHVDLSGARGVTVARCGGPTRAGTVSAGLAELARLGAGPRDWVLVHDAARCLVRPEWIDALIDACIGSGRGGGGPDAGDAVGGLLAAPLADTLKRADGAGRAAETLPRAGLWLAQTPQMFRLGLLAEALAEAGPGVTDEASAVEAMGLAPRLVAAPAENFKVTHGSDFAVAEALLRARLEQALR